MANAIATRRDRRVLRRGTHKFMDAQMKEGGGGFWAKAVLDSGCR
jgi:hypothetical protein